jgi:hypothetical protein
MRQNIIIVIAQKAHFEYIMNEAFKTTFILKHHLLLILILKIYWQMARSTKVLM